MPAFLLAVVELMSACDPASAQGEQSNDKRHITGVIVPPSNEGTPILERVLAQSPVMMQAWSEFHIALSKRSIRTRRAGELMALRAAQLTDSSYVWTTHRDLAGNADVSDAMVDALPKWRTSTLFTSAERICLEVSEQMTRGPAASTKSMQKLATYYDTKEIVELIVVVGDAIRTSIVDNSFAALPVARSHSEVGKHKESRHLIPAVNGPFGIAMPLAPADPDDHDLKEVFARLKKYGLPYIPNLYRTIADAPKMLQIWVDLSWTERLKAALPGMLRELLILRTAQGSGSDYDYVGHLSVAQAAGVSGAQIDALKDWRNSDLFDLKQRAALRVIDEIVETGAATHEAIQELSKYCSESEIVDVILTGSRYIWAARTSLVFRVSLDGKPIHARLGA